MWRPCSFTLIHSLTGPVGQPFTPCQGGCSLRPGDAPTLTMLAMSRYNILLNTAWLTLLYQHHRSMQENRNRRQQMLITIYHLLTKENKLYFLIFLAENKWKVANKQKLPFQFTYIFLFSIWNVKNGKEAQAMFLYPCTFCSSCKWKFCVCPFVWGGNKQMLSICKRIK